VVEPEVELELPLWDQFLQKNWSCLVVDLVGGLLVLLHFSWWKHLVVDSSWVLELEKGSLQLWRSSFLFLFLCL
jgi:hypothetical protein